MAPCCPGSWAVLWTRLQFQTWGLLGVQPALGPWQLCWESRSWAGTWPTGGPRPPPAAHDVSWGGVGPHQSLPLALHPPRWSSLRSGWSRALSPPPLLLLPRPPLLWPRLPGDPRPRCPAGRQAGPGTPWAKLLLWPHPLQPVCHPLPPALLSPLSGLPPQGPHTLRPRPHRPVPHLLGNPPANPRSPGPPPQDRCPPPLPHLHPTPPTRPPAS